jgi:hypothetical protein
MHPPFEGNSDLGGRPTLLPGNRWEKIKLMGQQIGLRVTSGLFTARDAVEGLPDPSARTRQFLTAR